MFFFSTAVAFSQTRVDTFVYVRDIFSGAPEERSDIQQNLKAGVSVLGFSVTENIREADYVVSCSIIGEALPLMTLTLLNTNEESLDSRDLVFTRPQETYDRFPDVLQSLFDGQLLGQISVNEVDVAPETAAADQEPANGVSANPGTAAVNQKPAMRDVWKHKVLFLNARLGVSNRYYLSDTEDKPTVLFTVDGGLEGELHPFKFLALQFGLNYAVDWDPRTSTLLNGTSVLSIPVMLKFIFNPSMTTTLGFYGGGYTNFVLLGTTTPPLLGVLGGVDLAVKAGPGAVLFDLRYSIDMGSTDVHDDNIESYKRMFLTLSAGYKFGFFARKH
jgi:hypothetical protein